MIDVGGERQLAPALGNDESCQSLRIQNAFSAQLIVGNEGTRLGEYMTDCGRRRLYLRQRTVLAENRQRLEEGLEPGLLAPIAEIAAHEVRTEQIRPVATRPIALRCSVQIEMCLLEKG